MIINQNFINILDGTMEKAMARKITRSIGENYKGNGNIYYQVEGQDNSLLIRIKDQNYILTDQYIESNGVEIDLVPILSRISFCIDKTRSKEHNSRERVKGCVDINGVKKLITIERIIRSIKINEKISLIEKNKQIHHVHDTWDNRIISTQYIPSKDHKGRKSHVHGICINSINDFSKLIIKTVYKENN